MMGVQLHLAVRPNRKEMGMPRLRQMGVKNTMITGPLSGEPALGSLSFFTALAALGWKRASN